MKKLQILTATAGILLALASPTLAAQRTHNGYQAYGSTDSVDRSGAYNYGPQYGGTQALTPAQHQFDRTPQYSGQNLPYADRPYGDPDSW